MMKIFRKKNNKNSELEDLKRLRARAYVESIMNYNGDLEDEYYKPWATLYKITDEICSELEDH